MSNGKVMQVDEFRVGDLVRVEKGERAVENRCTIVQDGNLLFGAGFSLSWYARDRWTLILLDRPAPPLPTAFGSVVLATVGGVKRLLSHDGTPFAPWGYQDGLVNSRWVEAREMSDVTVLFDAGEVNA